MASPVNLNGKCPSTSKVLTGETINPYVKQIQYAVRGAIVQRAGILEKELAKVPVVQTLDSAIHWINHYPLDNSIGFASVYPLDCDLSDGQGYPLFEQLGPDFLREKFNILNQ